MKTPPSPVLLILSGLSCIAAWTIAIKHDFDRPYANLALAFMLCALQSLYIFRLERRLWERRP